VAQVSAQVGALWVANWEGPYHVDPRDPGGATAYGVSIRYNADRFTDAQLRSLTPQGAADYFVERYWPRGANALPDYLSIPLMSFSVVEGPTQAVYALQRALDVKVDGDIGKATIAAAATTAPTGRRDEFLTAFFRACRKRFAESAGWSLDGEGWEARQFAASLAAKSWAVPSTVITS
jgi:lysozyme family protein